MSLFDGLLFWLGKMLAEFVVGVGIVMAIVIVAIWLEIRK